MRPPRVAVLLLAAVALAGGGTATVQAQQRPSDDRCKCRANGRGYDLGQRACIETPDGPRMARCRLVLNNTSWEIEAEGGCVESRLDGLDRG